VKKLAKKLTNVFSSGCLGGLVNSVLVWLLGRADITAESLALRLHLTLRQGGFILEWSGEGYGEFFSFCPFFAGTRSYRAFF